MNTPQFLFFAFVLFCIAVGCWLLAKVLRRKSGLPEGEIVYDDAGGADNEELYSAQYGLRGKPDYLLAAKNDSGLIPVEVKSGNAPRNGKPYASHVMQLAVYFLLVEDVLDEDVPYGLIRYRDRSLRVENSDELREELFAVLDEMREILHEGFANRSHNHARRCAGCSVAYACDERLE